MYIYSYMYIYLYIYITLYIYISLWTVFKLLQQQRQISSSSNDQRGLRRRRLDINNYVCVSSVFDSFSFLRPVVYYFYYCWTRFVTCSQHRSLYEKPNISGYIWSKNIIRYDDCDYRRPPTPLRSLAASSST